MTYKEILRKHIGSKCYVITEQLSCEICFGAEESMSDYILVDVNDEYVILKYHDTYLVHPLNNTRLIFRDMKP